MARPNVVVCVCVFFCFIVNFIVAKILWIWWNTFRLMPAVGWACWINLHKANALYRFAVKVKELYLNFEAAWNARETRNLLFFCYWCCSLKCLILCLSEMELFEHWTKEASSMQQLLFYLYLNACICYKMWFSIHFSSAQSVLYFVCWPQRVWFWFAGELEELRRQRNRKTKEK